MQLLKIPLKAEGEHFVKPAQPCNVFCIIVQLCCKILAFADHTHGKGPLKSLSFENVPLKNRGEHTSKTTYSVNYYY